MIKLCSILHTVACLQLQWQWQCCQSSCHLCWRCHCPLAQSVQWWLQWCTRDCRGAELSWEVVSCAAPLSCPSPFCEAGLLPPSMQGEGTVSTQVQKGRGHQQGRRRRRERRCRLTQPTYPLIWATKCQRNLLTHRFIFSLIGVTHYIQAYVYSIICNALFIMCCKATIM